MAELNEILSAGLRDLSQSLSPAQQQQLLDYVQLLEKWNRSFNLTALREPEEMVTYHLLDSLSVLPHLPGNSVLDVGSGAGLPGIPLAIARPDKSFVLLDSNGKKTRFMQQAVYELGLANVTIARARIEQYRPERAFDTVISRAFSSLADFVLSCQGVCSLYEDACLLAMKGRQPAAELEELEKIGYGGEVHRLSVPGIPAERHLVILKRG